MSSFVSPDDMHVTVCYSKRPLDWAAAGAAPNTMEVVTVSGKNKIQKLGDKGAVVQFVDSPELQARHSKFRSVGASHDYPSYVPHMSITYSGAELDTDKLVPFPGTIYLGGERFQPVKDDWSNSIREVSMGQTLDEMLEHAVVVSMPTIVKARPATADGRRIVEVEASSEAVDADGDIILQSALLKSAASFIASGVLDIDHLSEFGYRLGIPDPASYVVGRPLEVKALPGNRTSVVGEIRKSIAGVHDPARNKYDEFWDSLQSWPPVIWYSSVYGYPIDGMLDDCRNNPSPHGATRFLFKAMDWRSLAFTRNPKNSDLRGAARVVTAKSFLADLVKADMFNHSAFPGTMESMWNGRICDKCAVHKSPSLFGYRDHLIHCSGMSPEHADIGAHALMHKTNVERFVRRKFDIGYPGSAVA